MINPYLSYFKEIINPYLSLFKKINPYLRSFKKIFNQNLISYMALIKEWKFAFILSII